MNPVFPGEPTYEKTIEVTDEPALALTPEIEKRLKEVQPPITVVPLPGTKGATDAIIVPDTKPAGSGSLLGIIAIYMGGTSPCFLRLASFL